jgi:hypothetical protein
VKTFPGGAVETKVIVHTGMAKCMSTTLQNFWGDASGYALGLLDATNTQIEDIIIQHNGDRQVLQRLIGSSSITFDVKKDKVNVFSSEGISNAFNGRPGSSRFQSVKQELMASIFSRQSETLLFVVRDPIRWVRSIYAQHLREGGTLDLANYLSEHRNFLLETLNLEKTLRPWVGAGFEVVVLPLELASSWEQYWGLYEQYLGVPRPPNYNEKTIGKVEQNHTRYDRLSAQKALNEVMHLLLDGARGQPLTPEPMLSAIDSVRLLGTRSGLDNMTDEQFARLCRLINPGLLVGEDLLLDLDLIEAFVRKHADSHFVPVARDFCPPECRSVINGYSTKPAG